MYFLRSAIIGFKFSFWIANSSASSVPSKYSAFTYSPAKPNISSFTSSLNLPCKLTKGTCFPVSSSTNKAGTPAFLATIASSAPNVGAMWTTPVPSSVVTKSPVITTNALSGLSQGNAYGINCSYFNPAKSVPLHSPPTKKGIDFPSPSNEITSSKVSTALYPFPNCFPTKFLAKTTWIGSFVYWLNEWTKTYSIFCPTQSAVLDGNVQGVVVHAKKCAFSISTFWNGNACPDLILNWATQVVSFTSW